MLNSIVFWYRAALSMPAISILAGGLASAEAQETGCWIVDNQLRCNAPPEDNPGGATASTNDWIHDTETVDSSADVPEEADVREELESIVDEVGSEAARDMIDEIERESESEGGM